MAALAACATVPLESGAQDAAGKRFDPPPPGQAALYVFRESVSGAAYVVTAWLGPRALGQLGADTWFRIEVEPGTYQLRCTTAEASQLVQVAIAAGEIRFVEIAFRLGFTSPRCAIFEVMPEQGRKAVSAGRRALPL
jgi:hypothetical protein